MIKIHTFNPHIGRIKLLPHTKGVKAAAISGTIYGALLTPIMNISLFLDMIWFRSIARATPWEMLVEYYTDIWYWVGIIMYAIIGTIGGLITAWIFVDIYDSLPGKNPTMKGIVIGFIQWISLVLFVATPFGWASILMSLGNSILWGLSLGHFCSRESLGKL
jgi:hypothetical protein